MDIDSNLSVDELIDVAVVTVMVAVATLMAMVVRRRRIAWAPSHHDALERERTIRSILYDDDASIIMIRMDRRTFYTLVDILRSRELLRDTIHISVEEQVLMFLHTVGHCQRNRVIGHMLQRSSETISRYFGKVLDAIGTLKDTFIHPPNGDIQPKIAEDSRFWPFFKDCIGAIDGTHLPARLPANIVGRFRGRYRKPTQNVMAVVNFNLQFTYVIAGWEGSANDATVLKDALERRDGLRVPEGKYFLVDAGYTTKAGFIAPYRKTRYHLKEFSLDKPPTTPKELFNLRHSSLRTTIERAFGILKQRFSILDAPPKFPFPVQVDIVLVCCILHNMIMQLDENDGVVREFDRRAHVRGAGAPRPLRTAQEVRAENDEWEYFRDQIAKEMWERDYGALDH